MTRLEIRCRHTLHLAELRTRIRDAARQARTAYGVDVEETSETRMLLKRGRYLAGSISITEKAITVVLELSWGLQFAADRIERGVRDALRDTSSLNRQAS